MTEHLPLFPLNTVLFPGAPLPLHIFEERYRLMIARCIEEQAPFGVTLIREGVETSSAVTFHDIGTTAQIGEGVRFEDGRYYLVATGQQRFRIESVVQERPYFVGAVSYLAEQGADLVAAEIEDLCPLYERYWRTLRAATGMHYEEEPLPDNPVDLSYHLAHRLRVEDVQKQHWLETDVATRLREITTVLRAELALLAHINPESPDRGWVGPGPWN